MSIPQRKFRIEGGTGRPAQDISPIAFEAPPMAMPDLPMAAPIEVPAPPSAVLEEIRALRTMIEPLYGVLENLKENYREELRSFASLKVDMTEIETKARSPARKRNLLH